MVNTVENSIPCSNIWFYDFIFLVSDHVHETSKEIFLVPWLFNVSWDVHLFKYASMCACTCKTLSKKPQKVLLSFILSFNYLSLKGKLFKNQE